jgi:hypothetical protein
MEPAKKIKGSTVKRRRKAKVVRKRQAGPYRPKQLSVLRTITEDDIKRLHDLRGQLLFYLDIPDNNPLVKDLDLLALAYSRASEKLHVYLSDLTTKVEQLCQARRDEVFG